MAEKPLDHLETGSGVSSQQEGQQIASQTEQQQQLTIVQQNLSTMQVSAQTLNKTSFMEGDNNTLNIQNSTINLNIGGTPSSSKPADDNECKKDSSPDKPTGETHIHHHHHYHGPVSANVISTGANAYIDKSGSTNIVGAVPSEERQESKIDQTENNVKEFLGTMKERVMRKDTGSSDGSSSSVKRQIQPTMAVADMRMGKQGKANRVADDSKNTSDTMDEIKLSQLHDPNIMGKGLYKKIFVLGDVGTGKTTITWEYVTMVLDGGVESLQHIELVHHISVSKVQNTVTTPFDLLVSQQARLDKTKECCGEKWLQENDNKSLFILDGLDQSIVSLSGDFAKLAKPDVKANTRDIILNLLSGDLYPEMYILATSRLDTFWELDPQLRSSKTVLLRGFEEEDLDSAILALAGKKEGTKINEALNSELRNLLPLCKTPIFLDYVIKVFKIMENQKPETLTALMSVVLKYFGTSKNWTGADPKSLAKLSYHGMIDNRYTFTDAYITRLQIDPSKLGGILSVQTDFLPGQECPEKSDHTWSLPHQSLQEYLAAVHVFDEDQEKFDQFASEVLNDSRMENVRKFVYGMTLNPATLKFCKTYVTDKSVSLEACQETLSKQLDTFLSGGSIDDIKMVSLLQECGSEVIARYKSQIGRISITEEFLKSEDEYSLMSLIQQCAPTCKVQIQRLELNPSFMKKIRETLKAVKQFKINVITVVKHIQTEHCVELTQLLPEINVCHVSLWTTDETVKNLLQTWINDQKAPCRRFALKGEFSYDTYLKIGQFLSEVGAEFFNFNQCQLTKDILKVLRDNIKKGSKLTELCICDDHFMAAETYEELPSIFNIVGVETLTLMNCNLTASKLESLNTGIIRNNAKLETMGVGDEGEMEPPAYHSLALLVGKTKAKTLLLKNNSITAKKIQEFRKAAELSNVEFERLGILAETSLDDECYEEIIGICTKANCELGLIGCNVSDEREQALKMRIRDVYVENE